MVRDRLPLDPLQHWLITGAGRGIGEALAREVRRQHPSAKLSLVDRDLTAVERVAAALGQATAIRGELALLDGLESILHQARTAHGAVDVLVNNAGVMWVGEASGFTLERTQALLAIDLLAPIRLVQLVLPEMRSRGSGCIINVASLAGVTPLQGCTLYGAAKAGIAHYSETLRAELLPYGIDVVTVYPGPVRTELERHARRGLKASWASRAAPVGEPGELASLIHAAARRGAVRVVYPRSYELAWRFPRLAGWITARFSPPPETRVGDMDLANGIPASAPRVAPDEQPRGAQTLAHSGYANVK